MVDPPKGRSSFCRPIEPTGSTGASTSPASGNRPSVEASHGGSLEFASAAAGSPHCQRVLARGPGAMFQDFHPFRPEVFAFVFFPFADVVSIFPCGFLKLFFFCLS